MPLTARRLRSALEQHNFVDVGAESGPDRLSYAAMATAGEVTAGQRDIFETAAHTMIDEAGAQAILLGGADLALVFDDETSSFPLVNCAEIHAEAMASYAILER